MDLPTFIEKTRGAITKLQTFLNDERENHPHFTNDFSEYREFFYLILMPLATYSRANYQCMSRNSKLYEISNLRQLDALTKMKNKDGVFLTALVPPKAELKIWLDVENVVDGNLNYPSGSPLLGYMGFNKSYATIPKSLPQNHCIYFDVLKFNYGTSPCTDKAMTVCYVPKTAQITRDRLFWETINDKIAELSNLELNKRSKLTLQNKLDELQPGNCKYSAEKTFSLADIMSLKQPVTIINQKQFLDKDTYFTLYPNFVQDVERVRQLIYSSDIEADCC